MKRCPECYEEFVDKKKTCTDCGAELIDDRLYEESETVEAVQMTYLTTASSEINANMLTGMLESYEIKTFREYREAGAYLAVYMGDTGFGIDLFVDETQLKKAQDLIEQVAEPHEPADGRDTDKPAHIKWFKRSFLVLCIILFLL